MRSADHRASDYVADERVRLLAAVADPGAGAVRHRRFSSAAGGAAFTDCTRTTSGEFLLVPEQEDAKALVQSVNRSAG